MLCARRWTKALLVFVFSTFSKYCHPSTARRNPAALLSKLCRSCLHFRRGLYLMLPQLPVGWTGQGVSLRAHHEKFTRVWAVSNSDCNRYDAFFVSTCKNVFDCYGSFCMTIPMVPRMRDSIAWISLWMRGNSKG